MFFFDRNQYPYWMQKDIGEVVDQRHYRDPLERARDLDDKDHLAKMREAFYFAESNVIYLDGNSLGRQPKETQELLSVIVNQQWGNSLISAWEHWVELPFSAGDLLAEHVLGASRGRVLVTDSTTVNLFKLAGALLANRGRRRTVLIEGDSFPTDRYVIEGLAQQHGVDLVVVQSDPVLGVSLEALEKAFSDDVIFACFSMVSYLSAAKLDIESANRIAKAKNSTIIWDLSHAAGAQVIDLEASGSEFGVGCSYKYLNAGPGAPAYLYVHREFDLELLSPIRGWFSQANQFDMAPRYDPRPDIGRFMSGTPNIIGTALVAQGAKLVGAAGVGALQAKSAMLGDFFIEVADTYLAQYGFEVASPRDSSARGAHVSLAHVRAKEITRVLASDVGVIVDFRMPNLIRFGFAPLYVSFYDVADAVSRIVKVAKSF